MDSSSKPFSIVCHTFDLTVDSARLGGVTSAVVPGQNVLLQRFGMKASFRIEWVGKGSRRGQCGLSSLEPHRHLWGISLSDRQKDEFWVKPTPKDRRRFRRHTCSGAVQLFTAIEYPFWAEMADISASGVYVKTVSPLGRGTPLRIRVDAEGFSFESHTVVATCHPMVGMALRFTVMTPEHRSELRKLLESLRFQSSAEPGEHKIIGEIFGEHDEIDSPVKNA